MSAKRIGQLTVVSEEVGPGVCCFVFDHTCVEDIAIGVQQVLDLTALIEIDNFLFYRLWLDLSERLGVIEWMIDSQQCYSFF